MARINDTIKKEKEKVKEKRIRKDGDPNEWGPFFGHVGGCLLYTFIYALLGANFIIYASLTKDKKDDFSKKLNEYFRIDNAYYNCIGDEECTKVYDEIPYKYYERIPEDYNQKGMIERMFYLFFPSYTPVEQNCDANKNGGDTAVNGTAAPPTVAAADGATTADGAAPPADGAAPPADGTAPPADGTAPPADGTAPAADGAAPPADGAAPPTADGTAPPTTGGRKLRKPSKTPIMKGGAGLVVRKDIMKVDKYESLYFFQKIYIDIKNWLIESIAGSYYGERSFMHYLFYNFTPNNEEDSSTMKTFKMAFYPFISMFVIFCSYFAGFAHCVYQSMLSNVIYSIIFFMLIFGLAMFVGATQFAELTIKLLIAPAVNYRKEVIKLISEQPQLLIFVFCTLVISGAFNYLDSEICFAMSGFYFCYALYTFYYFLSERYPELKISKLMGMGMSETK
jgi:hypothetical protein